MENPEGYINIIGQLLDVISECFDAGLVPLNTNDVSNVCIDLGKITSNEQLSKHNNLYEFCMKRQNTIPRNFQLQVFL